MMADIRDELHCPICLDIFTDPVTLACGHNFCSKCIDQVVRRTLLEARKCPQCRKRIRSRPGPSKNTILNNIALNLHMTELGGVACTYCNLLSPAVRTCLQCEISMCKTHLQHHNRSVKHNMIQAVPSLEEKKCPTHKKMRGYYCTVDAACICMSCCFSKEYLGLRVEPLDEAYEKKKMRLRLLLETLTGKKEENLRKIQNLNTNIQKIYVVQGDPPILSKKMQILLCATNQIQELEEENKELELKKNCIENLCKQSDPLTVLEELVLDTDDCTDTRRDASCAGDRDMGLLKVKKWWFPTQKPADISLNVNTAASDILVSDNLKALSCIYQAQPETLEEHRFQHNQVLSLNTFSSGRHYWDVESSQPGDWMIGVCYPSMEKRGRKSYMGCNRKSWCLRRRRDEFWLQHNNRCFYLPHVTSCNNVRVSLDYSAGQLSFHDLGCPIRHLHTYRIIFIEPLHAAFTLFSGWLRITNSGDAL